MSVDPGWWGKWREEGIGVRHSTWGNGPDPSRTFVQEGDRARQIWIVKDGRLCEHDCTTPIGFVRARNRL